MVKKQLGNQIPAEYIYREIAMNPQISRKLEETSEEVAKEM